MIVKVLVGRTEGFISSVGFSVNGIAFLHRGRDNNGLHWATSGNVRQALTELRDILADLKNAGNTIENESILDTITKEIA